MFFSSFSCFFVCHFVQTHIFATKVLLFSHICKRETYFFKKKLYFTSFSSPISLCYPFVCHLPAEHIIFENNRSHLLSATYYHLPLHSSPYTLYKKHPPRQFFLHISKKSTTFVAKLGTSNERLLRRRAIALPYSVMADLLANSTISAS